MELLVEIVGWGGGILILLAYGLLSAGRMNGRSPAYQLLNVAGAAGFIVNGWWHGALPSATLNIIWLMIGVFALLRIDRTPGEPAPTKSVVVERRKDGPGPTETTRPEP